jgi:hypothetical protein
MRMKKSRTDNRLCEIMLLLAMGVAYAPWLYGQELNAADTIERFRHSFDWSTRFSANVENSLDAEGFDTFVQHFQIRRDGERALYVGGTTEYIDKASGKPIRRKANLPDIEELLFLNNGASNVMYVHTNVSSDMSMGDIELNEGDVGRQKRLAAHMDNCGPLLGYCYPFSRESLPELLGKSEHVSIAEEEVNGVKCQRLETHTPYGALSVWIAPELGYSLQKCSTTTRAGVDLGNDGTPFKYEWNDHITVTAWFSIESVQVKRVGDAFVPVSLQYSQMTEDQHGTIGGSRISITVSDLELSPQFDAASFTLQKAVDGVEVRYVVSEERTVSGYEWRNGKVSMLANEKTREGIVATMANIASGKSVNSESTASQSDDPNVGKTSPSGYWSNRMFRCIGLGVIGGGLLLLGISGRAYFRRAQETSGAKGEERS